MSTLKICSERKTIWITGVKRIIELKEITIDSGDILKCAENAGIDLKAHVTHLIEFKEGTDLGKVIQVECSNQAPELYVLPHNIAFLISDSGKTIDRI